MEHRGDNPVVGMQFTTDCKKDADKRRAFRFGGSRSYVLSLFALLSPVLPTPALIGPQPDWYPRNPRNPRFTTVYDP